MASFRGHAQDAAYASAPDSERCAPLTFFPVCVQGVLYVTMHNTAPGF